MCIDGRKQICGSSIFESGILVFTLKTEHFILDFFDFKNGFRDGYRDEFRDGY